MGKGKGSRKLRGNFCPSQGAGQRDTGIAAPPNRCAPASPILGAAVLWVQRCCGCKSALGAAMLQVQPCSSPSTDQFIPSSSPVHPQLAEHNLQPSPGCPVQHLSSKQARPCPAPLAAGPAPLQPAGMDPTRTPADPACVPRGYVPFNLGPSPLSPTRPQDAPHLPTSPPPRFGLVWLPAAPQSTPFPVGQLRPG